MHWSEKNIKSQAGKMVIVTGANSGIGFETARVLAAKGAKVFLACRNEARGAAAVARINAEGPAAEAALALLDLSSLDSVRAFAAAFKEQHARLDLLINNAGVMIPPYTKTVDGFELQFGTNHLGHFALTGLLLEVLLNTPQSRVVNVASLAHRIGKIDLADPNWERRKYKAWAAYGASKIANLHFTYELARKLEAAGAKTISAAAHPGWTATNLQKNSGFIEAMNGFFAMTPQQGALPTLRAATDPETASGDYYGPSGLFEIKGHPVHVKSSARARDEAIAARLWTLSQELTGVTFLGT